MLNKHTTIMLKTIGKIILFTMVLMICFIFIFHAFYKKLLLEERTNDQNLLQQEQNLLNTSISDLQEDLRVAWATKQNILQAANRLNTKKKKDNSANTSSPEDLLVKVEQEEKALHEILDYHQAIFDNNALLLEHYDQPERLAYEIRRSELLLSDFGAEDANESSLYFMSDVNRNYLFRRASMEQMTDELPFLLANQQVGQNPYPALDGLSGTEMIANILKTPLSYLMFLFFTLPTALLFTDQFARGRMNTFFK